MLMSNSNDNDYWQLFIMIKKMIMNNDHVKDINNNMYSDNDHW